MKPLAEVAVFPTGLSRSLFRRVSFLGQHGRSVPASIPALRGRRYSAAKPEPLKGNALCTSATASANTGLRSSASKLTARSKRRVFGSLTGQNPCSCVTHSWESTTFSVHSKGREIGAYRESRARRRLPSIHAGYCPPGGRAYFRSSSNSVLPSPWTWFLSMSSNSACTPSRARMLS